MSYPTQKVLLICLFVLISATLHAEQSTDSTGQYEMDLGQVYGAIKAVKYMKEICADSFPEFIHQNEGAYQKWRGKYKLFLQEIEKHFSALLWRESGGDPEKHMELLNNYDNALLGYKKGLSTQMHNDGKKVFRGTCKIYPVYLTTDQTNLEYFYTEQVGIIRKGST